MDTMTELTPEALIDLEIPRDVQLSPTGTHVVYCTSPAGKRDEHPVSSIWWAEVGKEHSARQLTSGLYNDESPQFCPDAKSIAFLSDRAERGKTSAIYVLPLGRGEPYYLTNKDNKKKISKLAWSPNGQFIAFNSPDEKSKEQEDREAETGGAKVYGESWGYNCLRCLHVATRRVSTLVSVDADVFDFAWKEDSTEIAYITQKTPEINSSYYHGLEFSRVNVARVCPFPSKPLLFRSRLGSHTIFRAESFATPRNVLSLRQNASFGSEGLFLLFESISFLSFPPSKSDTDSGNCVG